MSRVGKVVIQIPNGVSVEYVGGLVTVKGPNGTLTQEIKQPIDVVIDGNTVLVKRGSDENKARALHGLYNRLIANMVTGVSSGFTKTLICNGVGYKAAMNGVDLKLNLGKSHPDEIKHVEGVKFKILTPQEVSALNMGLNKELVIQVSGASKELVGSVASKSRGLRPVEPYHLYGVRYSDERVMRKESKSGAKGKKK